MKTMQDGMTMYRKNIYKLILNPYP